MKDSKFTNWTNEGGFRIPPAALTMAKISQGEKLDFHVADDVIVTLKHKMNALEMIHAIDALSELSDKLLNELVDCCGSCDDCLNDDEDEDEGDICCPYGTECAETSFLPPKLLHAAGIPEKALIMAEVDKAAHQVILSEFHSHADLSDVPEYILDTLKDLDVRLCLLESHLRKGDIIHG